MAINDEDSTQALLTMNFKKPKTGILTNLSGLESESMSVGPKDSFLNPRIMEIDDGYGQSVFHTMASTTSKQTVLKDYRQNNHRKSLASQSNRTGNSLPL